jgi:serine/threonine protein phosphatase PrpC
MNKTVTSVVALSLTTATAPPAFVAACCGDSRCRACKNWLYAQDPQSGSERQRKERASVPPRPSEPRHGGPSRSQVYPALGSGRLLRSVPEPGEAA